jgi:asparagine synthase (glutamine-hydrolysing)
MDALLHRGPNGTGVWTSPSYGVSLAHARLATIDLSNGQQPIANEDGTVVAVINGEFYETEPLRRHLENVGHRFKTRTDSEVLIHLYEQCGVACLGQLHGEFAFVLWDESRRRLFAARDRFGAKPLYYSETGGEMLLASEIKALQRAGLSLSWDEQGFYEQFAFQRCLSGKTLYRGVRELAAGHYLLRTANSSEIRCYWDLDYQLEAAHELRTDDDWAGQLHDSLEKAVRARLKADVPVACYLSGGIDSTSILGLMSRQNGPGVAAFCASFDGCEWDEFPIAARSAAYLGARLTRVPVTSASIAADFKPTIRYCENLIGNANSVAKFALSRAVSQAGYKVVLTGEGADELFAGYPNLVADALRGLLEPELEQLRLLLGVSSEKLREVLNPLGRTFSAVVMERLGYSPMWLELRRWLMQKFEAILPPTFSMDEMERRLLDSLDRPGQLAGRSVLNQSCYLHAKTCFAGVTLSSLGDRVEMAHSVEGRLPFLDHRVVDVARRAPAGQKVRNGAEKLILRNAMRHVIPPEICGRRKQAISAPPALWEKGSEFGDLLQDTLRSRYLASLPFVNSRAVIAMLDEMADQPAARNGLEAPMIALASACVLAECLRVS